MFVRAPGRAVSALLAAALAVWLASSLTASQALPRRSDSAAARDLSVDESMGGHTLARHVGKTDAELADRLRRERVSAASTYTDRATAERIVGAAIAAGGRTLTNWERRNGRRPNLVLHYVDPGRRPLGRSLARGQRTSQPATRALVVLKWNERTNSYFVLTSYPEADR